MSIVLGSTFTFLISFPMVLSVSLSSLIAADGRVVGESIFDEMSGSEVVAYIYLRISLGLSM